MRNQISEKTVPERHYILIREMSSTFSDNNFSYSCPLKLSNIMEYAFGTAIGLCFFVISLYILGTIVHMFTGDRYFAPSIHKMKGKDEKYKSI